MTDPGDNPDAPISDATGDPVDLPHLAHGGRPRMVDVSEKPPTTRTAVAEGHIVMGRETLTRLVEAGGVRGAPGKGDVLRVAELAGIQAAKRTGELIPLCHMLPAVSVTVELEADSALPGIRARARARIQGSTGVELEALTAVSVALLTVYDMGKAVDRGMHIEGIRLLEKAGGRTGLWRAGDDAGDD